MLLDSWAEPEGTDDGESRAAAADEAELDGESTAAAAADAEPVADRNAEAEEEEVGKTAGNAERVLVPLAAAEALAELVGGVVDMKISPLHTHTLGSVRDVILTL